MPRSCSVKNTYSLIGLVLYTGHETKVMKNTKLRTFKQSRMEKLMNRYIMVIMVILFVVLLFVSLYSVLYKMYNYDFLKVYQA